MNEEMVKGLFKACFSDIEYYLDSEKDWILTKNEMDGDVNVVTVLNEGDLSVIKSKYVIRMRSVGSLSEALFDRMIRSCWDGYYIPNSEKFEIIHTGLSGFTPDEIKVSGGDISFEIKLVGKLKKSDND